MRGNVSTSFLIFILSLRVCSSALALPRQERSVPSIIANPAGQITWQSPATIKNRIIWKSSGTLQIGSTGIEFRSAHGLEYAWTFVDVKSFDLTPHTLIVESYQSKSFHRPGEKSFHFHLKEPIPATVAADMAEHVGRPVKNADPNPELPSFAAIAAHHRLNFGGTNGNLYFRNGGIDYVTHGNDARSWRWSDINTVSSPDPYQLLVFGYLDTYRFDLKQPITRELLNRLTDRVFAHRPLDQAGERTDDKQEAPKQEFVPHGEADKGGSKL